MRNVAFAILLVLSFTALYFFFGQGDSELFAGHTIVYTERGFQPVRLRVQQGTIVIFKNDTDRPFWPASDFHPAHTIYSEFDASKPIEPGETYEFQFEKVGLWRYHDHLDASGRAVVEVVGDDALSVSMSLDEARGVCGAKSGRDAQMTCWKSYFIYVLEGQGLERTVQDLSQLRVEDSLIAGDCHTFMHDIGEAFYWKYAQKRRFPFRPELATCGFGFIHGFMQEFGHHSQDFLSEVGGLCDEISTVVDGAMEGSVEALDQCYHGVGHGIAYLYTAQEWEGEKQVIRRGSDDCAKLSEDPLEVNNCISGVFGGVASFYTGTHGYILPFPEEDPFSYCDFNSEVYQSACYDSLAPIVWIQSEQDLETAISYYTDLQERPSVLRQSIYNIADTSTRFYLGRENFDDVMNICTSLNGELRDACISGFSQGLVRNGIPDQVSTTGHVLCSSSVFSATDRKLCITETVSELVLVYPGQVREEFCSLFSDELEAICLE